MGIRPALVIGGGLALAVLAALGAWAILPVADWIEALGGWLAGLGPAGIAIFVVSYVIAILALVPAAPISVLAGMVYGFWAVPLALVSATTAGALAFLIARYAAGPSLRRMIEARPRFRAVDRAVAEEGWKIVGLLRLSPFVPFALGSYMLGVTSLTFQAFTGATFVGIIPGVVLYVYLGKLGQLAASGAAGPLQWAFFVVGLVATGAVAALIVRKAQEKLRQAGIGEPR